MYKYVKEYLEILRKANEAFNNNIKVKLFWNDEPMDREGFRKEFLMALDRRINLKGNVPITKKWDDTYQTHLLRDKRRLEDIGKRISVYQFETEIVRKRFSHLLSSYNDF